MQKEHEAIKKQDAVVLAVSVDNIEDNAELVENEGLDFSILSDSNLEVTKAYDLVHAKASINGTDIPRPAVFILDRQGNVKWRSITGNWRVRVRAEMVLEELKKIP